MIVRRTTARLTFTFTAIMLAVLAVAFVGIYVFATFAFDFDVVTTDNGLSNDGAVTHALDSLRTVLLLAYLAVALALPFVSWAMARLALRPLRRSYEVQAQFVDATSHEFRTPLGILLGELSWALLKRRTAAEYEESIRTSLETVESLSHLTDQLLLLSRDDRVELASGRERLPLSEIAAEAADLASRADGAADRLHIEAGDDVDVLVSRDLMVSAVRNLIDNALKFSGPDGTVTVRASRHGSAAVLTVSDDGPGLTKTDANRAFERFWRAPATSHIAGHGMGLPLVRSIVEAHGGRAELTGHPGGGATARINLDAV
ncbi:sensor histidine kinase [Demequina capsici]|uniref:histidine kinase n=1 Tax=Demequina capsici TaxID=3075620 RepID=A0AA96JCR7_9MICO|nr:HAMP domain-containing sensor histidine kinase [Demequina sp. OYTSA14]WNM23909.1 HAMP domain-containing sensor histidine kinase [Demequina sp. OYTSA14]